MLMKKLISSITFFALVALTPLFSQTENPDFFESIGKIYVVVAVLVAIFIGIVFFLIYVERKLNKLENQIIDNE